MKKITAALVGGVLILGLTACEEQSQGEHCEWEQQRVQSKTYSSLVASTKPRPKTNNSRTGKRVDINKPTKPRDPKLKPGYGWVLDCD